MRREGTLTCRIRRLLSAALAAAVVGLSPGPGACQAFAQAARGARAAAPFAPAAVVTVPRSLAAPSGTGALTATSAVVPSFVTPAPTLPASAPQVARTVSASPVAAAASAGVSAALTPRAPRGTPASSAAEVGAISMELADTLGSAGPPKDMEPAQAAGLGLRIQRLLSAERAAPEDGVAEAPTPAALGSFGAGAAGREVRLAPAPSRGWRSLFRSAGAAGGAPVPPAPLKTANAPGGRLPLLFRAVASALAIGPAAYFGPALWAAGAWVPGALLAASSLGLAALPWLGPSAPRHALAAPDVAIAALGAAAAVAAFGWGTAAGGLAVLAGWGFSRLAPAARARGGIMEQMSAMFGAFSAVAAAAMVLSGAPAWAPAGLAVVSAPATLRLLGALPRWCYAGVGHAATGIVLGTVGAFRVLGSLRTDTVLYDRLARLTERLARFGRFSWTWLGALWIPALALQAVQIALSGLVGTVLGILQMPALFAWGALDEARAGESRADGLLTRLADWERRTFGLLQGSKTAVFNPVERRFLPLVNSNHPGPPSSARR